MPQHVSGMETMASACMLWQGTRGASTVCIALKMAVGSSPAQMMAQLRFGRRLLASVLGKWKGGMYGHDCYCCCFCHWCTDLLCHFSRLSLLSMYEVLIWRGTIIDHIAAGVCDVSP